MYKTTLTKILQVKTNTILIDVYLNKLIQKLITNINAKKLNLIIETTTIRI